MQAAWEQGQDVTVHGVVYGMEEGLLQNSGFVANSSENIDQLYDMAVARIFS